MKRSMIKRIISGVMLAAIMAGEPEISAFAKLNTEICNEDTSEDHILYESGVQIEKMIDNATTLPGNPVSSNGVVTWDCVWFGNYWQEDTNGDGVCVSEDMTVSLSDGFYYDQHERRIYPSKMQKDGMTFFADNKQPLKWRILSIDADGNALLLSDRNIDVKEYNTTYTEVTWETCTLRSYLNSYGSGSNICGENHSADGFLTNAFNSSERSAIKTTVVKNPDNPVYGTEGGNNTEDKLFLLSLDEAMNSKYGFAVNVFTEPRGYEIKNATGLDKTRVALNTSYVAFKPEYRGNGAGYATTWWLRSPAYSNCDVAMVYVGGEVVTCVNDVFYVSVSVRPALRINLSDYPSLWKPAGTVCSDGTVKENASFQGGGAGGDNGKDDPNTDEQVSENKTNRLNIVNWKKITVYCEKSAMGTDTADKTVYQLCSDAVITTGNRSFTTYRDGSATIPFRSDPVITISKNGYVPVTKTYRQIMSCQDVYLNKYHEGYPVIKALYLDNTDVLHEKKELQVTSADSLTFKADIDWGSTSYGEVQICQESHSVSFPSGSDSLTTVLSEHEISTAEDIYISARGANGKVTKKKLSFVAATPPAVKNLDGLKFNLGDGIGITVPKNVPGIGGDELKFDLLKDRLPFTVAVDNGKVYVAIGIDLGELSYKKTNWNNNKPSYREKTETVKRFVCKTSETWRYIKRNNTKPKTESIFSSSDKKVSDYFKEINKDFGENGELKKLKSKFGVDGKITTTGFAEGIINPDGSIRWYDVGLIVDGKAEISYTHPFMLWAIPMYFAVNMGADVKVTAKLQNTINTAIGNDWTFEGTVNGELSLSGGLGVGASDLLALEGGIVGKLPADYYFPDNQLRLALTVNAYVKAKALFWEQKHDFEPWVNTVLYDNTAGGKDSNYDGADYALIVPTAASFNTLTDLSYMDVGDETENIYDGASGIESDIILKENSYKDAGVQLAVFEDGTALAVWIDGESSDRNLIGVRYCIYDGEDWGDVKVLDDDGTFDSSPSLAYYGNTAYLVYQDADRSFVFDDELSLEDIAGHMGLSAVKFENGCFDASANIVSGKTIVAQDISADENGATIAWAENSEGKFFSDAADYSVYSMSFDGSVGDIDNVISDSHMIYNLAVDKDGSDISVAWCADTDGSLETNEDVRIFENGTVLSDWHETAPVYDDHKLYRSVSGNIICGDDVLNTCPLGSDDYRIISGADTKMLVYKESEGLYSRLLIAWQDPDTGLFGSPLPLVDNESFIANYQTALSGAGLPYVLYNDRAVTGSFDTGYNGGDPYGNATIKVKTLTEALPDLSVADTWCEMNSLVPGETTYVDVTVSNNGAAPADAYLVSLIDSNGETVSKRTVRKKIYPGEASCNSVSFNVPEEFAGAEFMVKVTPGKTDGVGAFTAVSDADDTNNERSISFDYRDIALEDVSYGELEEGGYNISLAVVNRGLGGREGIKLALFKAGDEGGFEEAELVVEKNVDEKLAPFDVAIADFDVSISENSVYYVQVKDNDTDTYQGNDTVMVYVEVNEDEAVPSDDELIEEEKKAAEEAAKKAAEEEAKKAAEEEAEKKAAEEEAARQAAEEAANKAAEEAAVAEAARKAAEEAAVRKAAKEAAEIAKINASIPDEQGVVKAFYEDAAQSDIVMLPGESKHLSLTPSDSYIYGVKWTVDMASVKNCIKVKDGVVTAVKPGTGMVTASYRDTSLSFKITVADESSLISKLAQTGSKGYVLKSKKVLKTAVGKNGAKLSLNLPKKLKGASVSVDMLDASGNVISEVKAGRSVDASICSIEKGISNAAGTKLTYAVNAKDAGAAYVRFTAAYTDASGKTAFSQAVTKLIITKPVFLIDASVNELKLKPGEGKRIIVKTDHGNTDTKALSFKAKGKGIKVTKSGYVIATAAGVSGTVTVKCGKVTKVINVTVDDVGAENNMFFNRLSTSKASKKASSYKLAVKTAGDVDTPASVSYSIIGGSESDGVSVSDDGTVNIAADAKPGCYSIKASAGGYTDAYSELIVK